jgi:small subunit ribosomal protein S1
MYSSISIGCVRPVKISRTLMKRSLLFHSPTYNLKSTLKVYSYSDVDRDLSDDEMYSMFDKLLKNCVFGCKAGDKVTGRIVSIDKKTIYVDMNLKDYALLPRDEVSLTGESAENLLSIGESREFLVINVMERDVRPIVSIKALEMETAWARVREQLQAGSVIESPVIEATKGGYRVDLGGLKSFLPVSQICPQYLIGELMGKIIPVKLIDVDESKNRCVCSNRKAMAENENAASTLARLKVGDVVSGHVQNVTGFGVFVDLSGVAGLLHVSQISNDRVNNPEGVFQIGEPIKCMVLAIDKEKSRLSLTTKKLEPSSGDMLRNRGLVMEKAEEMAHLFRERVAAAEAAVKTSEQSA